MGVTLTLTIVDGTAAGSVFRFRRFCRVVVGRAQDADIRLDDQYVSRHHVLLEFNPPSCHLHDLTFSGGGNNFPRINGENARNRDLSDGDVIELGRTHLRFGIEWRGVNTKPGNRAPRCSQCGSDLGADPGFEGPVPDLKDPGTYICRKCLPEGDECAGSLIGDYELRRVLGAGNMGTVYLAWHHRTNTLVALKQIGDLGGESVNRRFAKEFRVLRRMSHPGIARFIDSGMHAGAPFLVMEYVAGERLEYRSVLGQLSPVETAIRVIAGVLETLGNMHAMSSIHGDIKPHNITIASREMGADPITKLREFGFALCGERAGVTPVAARGKQVESYRFLAPERAGGAPASVLSDLYSVGATLYYLLSGQVPFDFPAENPMQVFEAQRPAFRSPVDAARALRKVERMMYPDEIVRREKPVGILDRNAALPGRVALVVDRAVSKDPQGRFQTAAEFRSALLDAAGQDDVL